VEIATAPVAASASARSVAAYRGGVVASATRAAVLGVWVRAQQLDRDSGTLADTAVLDLGVQDTGPGGGRWRCAALMSESLSLSW